jgi:3-oxoacyl-[acyl-carrier-protein] synthase II
MEVAGDMIRLDRASHVIVVAGDCPDVFKYLWFKKIGMYEEDGKIKPFSSKAKGFVMGEGAVALILTDLETAMEEKSHIYGEYLGGGFRLESWGVTTPMIGSDYFQEAIDDALKISGMGIQDIDLICAHGAGTVSSDYHEARAIMNILGDSNSVPVVAWKSYVGHNLGGSNLLELAILLLSMEHSYVPSIMHNFETDRRIKIDLVKEDRRIPINVALKMCCAMAGYNSAIVIRRLEEKFGQRV